LRWITERLHVVNLWDSLAHLGIRTMTIKRNPKLSQVEAELKMAICFVGSEDIMPWMMRIIEVRRNVCQFCGT
jgi:hypothetical protein